MVADPYAVYRSEPPQLDCLPWWHTVFAPYTGSNRQILTSGCVTVGGRVQCAPEIMRAHAEQQLRLLGLWQGGSLPLAVYTLARYTASEVGNGPPEEKVAVALAAINRVRLGKLTDVNELLLYRLPGTVGYGAYGPIHGSEMDAPYGRWASTSRDPGIDDLLIADFVLTGRAENFNRGGDDQNGPEVEGDANHPVGWQYRAVVKQARNHDYWVGPLPGVDHWRTFQLRHLPTVDPNSPVGLAYIAAAQAALSERPTPWQAHVLNHRDWSRLPVCAQFQTGRTAKVAAVSLLAVALVGGLAYVLLGQDKPLWPKHSRRWV